ncbi:unnamed protein product [Diatraea saccharalis]|uniref:Uncharacterized protein n=1 Tax=Diatraea saccharalis TaxID=40085 RepID=A0A9N9WHC5_9NEOP|nr:unnamed protein product [Diatraea saccharalis]
MEETKEEKDKLPERHKKVRKKINELEGTISKLSELNIALKKAGVLKMGVKEGLAEIACDTKNYDCMYNNYQACKIKKPQYETLPDIETLKPPKVQVEFEKSILDAALNSFPESESFNHVRLEYIERLSIDTDMCSFAVDDLMNIDELPIILQDKPKTVEVDKISINNYRAGTNI